MQVNTGEGKEIFPHDRERTGEIVSDFVDAVDAPKTAAEPFLSLIEGMADKLDQTAQEAAQARERAREAEARVEELEDELDEARQHSGQERAELAGRVSELEEAGSVGTNPTHEEEQTTLHKPETPLEEVVQLPEHLAEENLSANQQRARFVAKDIQSYTQSVPAGRAIRSSELRRVLAAGKGGTVYTETVSRVIEFLDGLGKDSVKIRETRSGERAVIFSDELVKRIAASSNTVVAEGGATG